MANPATTTSRRSAAATHLAPSSRPARAPLARRALVVQCQSSQRRSVVAQAKPGESQAQANERRIRESARVEERAELLTNFPEFTQKLAVAGDKLVCIEFQSDQVCQMTWDEPQPELHWKLDQDKARKDAMAKCCSIKHTFQRIARECKDVMFLEVEADNVGEGVLRSFGVDTLPTVQFWKKGAKLWEVRGAQGMEQELGTGVMYYGDAAAGGEKATSYVRELSSTADFEAFVAGDGPQDKTLKVVNFALTTATPCVHIYPAMVALARSFQGHASFSRLIGDAPGASPDLMRTMAKLGIVEVPTFLFYRGGKCVSRYVGSSRGDLIGRILELQAQAGLSVPPPPGQAVGAKPSAQRRKWGAKDLV